MEKKTSECPSYLLERQERVSVEGHQRIYIKNTQVTKVRELFRRPLARVSGSTSIKPKAPSSFSSVKIQETLQKVEVLNVRIGHELNRLERFRNHFLEVKEAMNRSPSLEKAEVKNLTWSQSLKANQAKDSPLSVNRSPASGSQQKVKWAKCRTIGIAVTKKSPNADKKRARGGYCCNCDYCTQGIQSVCQNQYGTTPCCNCLGNCSGNCDMAYHQQFCAYGDLNGSPHQGTQFGISYIMYPRPTCGRLVTDLNTEVFCRHWRPKIERAVAPKERKDCGTQVKCQEKRNPSRSGKCINSKKLECNVKRVATSPVHNKCRKPEKAIKIERKKEHESTKDHGQKKCKPIDSRFPSSKGIPCKAQPSKVCSDELNDEIDSQSYQEYFNLYNQQNCKPPDPNPTYTRMAGKEDTRLPKLEDTNYSDRITDHYTENSYSFGDETEHDCLRCKERSAHYQLDDMGSGTSIPDGVPYRCCDEKVSYTNGYGYSEEMGYISPDAILRVKSHIERSFQRSGEATNANRTHAQQSKSLMSKGNNYKAVKWEHSEKRVQPDAKCGDRRIGAHPVQRSVTVQSRGPTSYTSIPLQHPSAMHETKDTQTECSWRERPTQTERHISMDKGCQVCREHQQFRDQLNPASAASSHSKKYPSNSMATMESEIAKAVMKSTYFDKEHCVPARSKHESSSNRKKRSDYGHVHEKGHSVVVDCREGSPRTQGEIQHITYKQPVPQEVQTLPYSPRTPPLSYGQHKSYKKEYITQTPPQGGASSRSHSPYRNSSVEDLSLSSHKSSRRVLANSRSSSPYRNNPAEDLSLSAQSQCSQCQKNSESTYIQNMPGNIDCFRTDDDSFQMEREHCTNVIPSRCVETSTECVYCEGEHPEQSCKQHSPRSCMSSPRQLSVWETVCEKRTRTVTFEDEKGGLTKEEDVEESCRSRIDWERALKYHTSDHGDETDYTGASSTCRSSSSAEQTCNESTCDDDFASCDESHPQTNHMRIPSFNGCPCMYQTYMNLATMCQNECGGFIQ
ncbi:uncharacterized protein LOC117141786 [Drosophila mauritiana]|uniref:Uncharacterized protein LOC117141786 n=1 Tax=Drosophila mauritiana TaxID=7226 RepID=A0A6P8KDJ7_DROMA|nr:uncharacterized protein LOC117141786 [Drosophila mauritiana]